MNFILKPLQAYHLKIFEVKLKDYTNQVFFLYIRIQKAKLVETLLYLNSLSSIQIDTNQIHIFSCPKTRPPNKTSIYNTKHSQKDVY